MNFYLLFKSLHLISVISWMAGLLYLPRIFVYHSEASHVSQIEVFKVMERKLYNFIMMPAMILSWLFGILLIHSLGISVFSELWMQTKGVLVLLLTSYHFYLGKHVKLFALNNNLGSSKFFRVINEIPTVLLIIIVFVVVFKPL
jgi:protoporphyrinogen IX oxidase